MDTIGLFVVISLAVLFVAPLLYMRVSASRAVGKSVPANIVFAEKDTNPEQTLYYYFMSKNCAMCTEMTPLIESLQRENPNIIEVDISQHPDQAKNFHVFGTPTLMAVENGLINKVKLGKLSLKKIKQFMAVNPLL